MRNTILALTALCAVACSANKTIDDDQMVSIITEALLTSSVASADYRFAQPGTPSDTVDFYTPILSRYDYTLDDFRHTIYQMSTRKSNPLNEIFTRVTKEIDSLDAVAEYRYNAALRYDTVALKFYSDTLYDKDTTIRGSLAKYKIVLENPQSGDYVVSFDYRSVGDYRAGNKAMRYRVGKKGIEKINNATRVWINRSNDTTRFAGKFTVNEPRDTLIVSFEEPTISKEYRREFRDTSFIRDIRIVFTPPLTKVRKDFFRRYFVDFTMFKYVDNHEKDSLPIHFRQ